MNQIKKVSFPSKKIAAKYDTFWQLFTIQSDDFFKTIKSNERVEEDFFEVLTRMLDQLYDGIFFLVGMENEDFAELILTPIGLPKNVLLVEELVAAAPKLTKWNFRALKPANPDLDFEIKFGNLIFNKHNISFFPILHEQYPDEIDLMFVYDHFHEEVHEEVFNGVFLFLENYLGEEIMIESIDNILVKGSDNSNNELIPIYKLQDYLIWREKEFVEKNHQMKYKSQGDDFISFEGTIDGNVPIVSSVNKNLIHWEFKTSHPWILSVILNIMDDSYPTEDHSQEKVIINKIQKDIDQLLPENKGYIFIGWHKIEGNIEIFYACQEYRRPSAALREIEANYAGQIDVKYDLVKDKYWRMFEWYASSGLFNI